MSKYSILFRTSVIFDYISQYFHYSDSGYDLFMAYIMKLNTYSGVLNKRYLVFCIKLKYSPF